jgi:hypothetical protein
MRFLAAALFSVLMILPALPQGTFDSAARMREALLGKPIRGAILATDFKTIDNRFVEEYAADGGFIGWYLSGEPGRYGGTWNIKPLDGKGDAICFEFGDGNPEQCYFTRITGKVLEFFDNQGRFVAVAAIEDQPAPELEALKGKSK